jgi:hypothetical protein
MTSYRLQRAGDVDLEFEAHLLSDYSSREDGSQRWTEVRIYQLLSGSGWVTETVGKSAIKGETDRIRVVVCRTPTEVRDSLRRREGEYIINAALDALETAAHFDVRLAPATVERL